MSARKHNKHELDRPPHDRELIRLKSKVCGMRSSSFYTLFRFAEIAKLVEFVREEKPLKLKGFSQLQKVETGGNEDGIIVVPSVRRFYQLTEKGKDKELWNCVGKTAFGPDFGMKPKVGKAI